MIQWFRRFLGGSAVEDNCKHGHDMNMIFPDPKSLGWEFRCSRCGLTTTDMWEAETLLHRG